MARETGVRFLTAFKLENGGKYGEPINLENCVSCGVTNNYKDIEYPSDCRIENSISILQSADVGIEMSSSLGFELLAKLTGDEYSNAKMSTVVGGIIPSFALAHEIVMDDATTRRRVLYNCNLKRTETNNDTESEGEVWTLEGKALPISYQGKQYVDTSMAYSEIMAITEPEAKASALEEYESFFTEVVMPN